jgi:hypothetical protein
MSKRIHLAKLHALFLIYTPAISTANLSCPTTNQIQHREYLRKEKSTAGQITVIEDMDNRLRATAVPFTPHDVQNSPRLSDASTYSALLSDRTVNMSVRSTDSQSETTNVDDCAFCASIGQLLVCCQSSSSPHPRPCRSCAEVAQLFAIENQKHEEEASALRTRIERLETESPKEKYLRLCEEKSA